MRTARCHICDRRRPVRKMEWTNGEPPFCADTFAIACHRASHRDRAKVTRWILGDHNNTERQKWRGHLAYHVAKSEARP